MRKDFFDPIFFFNFINFKINGSDIKIIFIYF